MRVYYDLSQKAEMRIDYDLSQKAEMRIIDYDLSQKAEMRTSSSLRGLCPALSRGFQKMSVHS